MKNNTFNYRSFTSLFLFFIFLIITVTGIILFIVPPGRIAYWNNWTFWGINKDGWQRIHTIFTFLFIIFSLIHLILYNWKTFTRYFKRKDREKKGWGKEVYTALAVTLLLAAGSIAEIPPFTTIMKGGEAAKNSWYDKKNEPPIPHAELLSLEELCRRLNIEADIALSRLRTAGFTVKNKNQRLGGIARKNKRSAKEIFTIIQNKQ